MEDILFCIVGRSGSGKDTLVDELLRRHPKWEKLKSKVTRKPRGPLEDNHIFTTHEEYMEDFKNGKVVAYNHYNGNDYWATKDQVDNSMFYIIDIPGLKELKKKYNGSKRIFSIGLAISPETSVTRMKGRGDDEETVRKRILIDNEAFSDLSELDVVFNADTIEKDVLASEVEALIHILLSSN